MATQIFLSSGNLYSKHTPPLVIVIQLVANQSFFYVINGLSLFLICTLGGFPRSTELLFNAGVISLRTPLGRCCVAIGLLSAVATGFEVAAVVERSAKCLDYSFSVFMIHYVVALCLTGQLTVTLPSVILNCAMFVIVLAISMHKCLREELADIEIMPVKNVIGHTSVGAATNAANVLVQETL